MNKTQGTGDKWKQFGTVTRELRKAEERKDKTAEEEDKIADLTESYTKVIIS